MCEATKPTREILAPPSPSRSGPLPSACPEENNQNTCADIIRWLTIIVEVLLLGSFEERQSLLSPKYPGSALPRFTGGYRIGFLCVCFLGHAGESSWTALQDTVQEPNRGNVSVLVGWYNKFPFAESVLQKMISKFIDLFPFTSWEHVGALRWLKKTKKKSCRTYAWSPEPTVSHLVCSQWF